ncbi:MAG: TlyA family RNA methyltransferase [Bdellovibrionota bacterium]
MRSSSVFRCAHHTQRNHALCQSRRGLKLAGVLDDLGIDPKGKVCLDVGASTGGFTDCLLQRGAHHVCCIDVGKGQLHPKIREHEKVEWKESFHVKDLTPSTFEVFFDLVTIDVSFISLRKVLPYVLPCLAPHGMVLAMAKPQFETQKANLHKGVVKDEMLRTHILEELIRDLTRTLPITLQKNVDAPIKGPKGNQETFLLWTPVKI